jgi:pimeloyl-ACP methyl ester carboxylesterase
MSKIYLIPGLGTDIRIFSKLIPLLNNRAEVECLEYREPVSRKESIPEYAQRLVNDIPPQEKPPILIGMSMGGAIATEMAKLVPHRQLVLISTYKHKSEVPLLFKVARWLPLYIFVPAWYVRIVVPFFARILGICNKEDSLGLKEMLKDRTSSHFAWARRAIIKWENEDYPEKYVHINGSKDHIFKKSKKQTTHTIQGGTHNMVMDKAEEIAEIINREVLDVIS